MPPERLIRRATTAAGLVMLAGSAQLPAQRWLFVEGLIDVEGWATDSGSRLLARNNGTPAPLGRGTLWAAVAPHPRLQVLAEGLLEAANGIAANGDDIRGAVHLAELRYLPSRALVVEAGRILHPVGAFGPRRHSIRNPLIGGPDQYPVNYPWGVQVSGVVGLADYRVAGVSLPLFHEGYTPEPDHTPHLAGGFGVTPFTGLRIGASFGVGPYLSDSTTVFLSPGTDWKSFGQRIVAADLRFARGYLELRAEAGLVWYDVPTVPEGLNGDAEYVELKYTWTPRFFTATRLERNRYPFIRPVSAAFWIAAETLLYNGEIGFGYRLTRTTLVKASYRRDYWNVDPADRAEFPDGYAVAIQLSQRFDPVGWFGGR
jgi:hypothetical protein